MTDQQAIDHLNTIINERESAVALKDVLALAITAQARVGEAERRAKDADTLTVAVNARLRTLEDDYRRKKEACEVEFDTYRRALAASKVDLASACEEYKKQVTAKMDALTDQLQSAQLATTKANDAASLASSKQIEAEKALAVAVKKYADYKASL